MKKSSKRGSKKAQQKGSKKPKTKAAKKPAKREAYGPKVCISYPQDGETNVPANATILGSTRPRLSTTVSITITEIVAEPKSAFGNATVDSNTGHWTYASTVHAGATYKADAQNSSGAPDSVTFST